MGRPLADRMRPTDFDDIVGQEHLFGKNGALRRMIESGHIANMIFFGPPGTGKTTCANIIAKRSGMTLYKLNATTASLADVRQIAEQTQSALGEGGILLYLDEIQYFNKKQQQSLLEYIEDGRITLIASTAENPFFSVYSAVISRCAVFEFKPVKPQSIASRLQSAVDILNSDNERQVSLENGVGEYIAGVCGGDVRRAITVLEHIYYGSGDIITKETADMFIPDAMRGVGAFAKDGDSHYDLLSAFQKSIRGSDASASVFYLAKLLGAGELLSVIRRLSVIASEDIGAAYPMASAITYACCQQALSLGLPEARIPLANCVIMLATSPKSVSALDAYEKAADDISKGLGKNIPSHLQDSHYSGAEAIGHGNGYKYPHAFENDYVFQQYLPNDIKDREYYVYGSNKTEQAAKAYWDKIKNKK
ncbi:MAG: replication-associated recombination protein A [Clostridia bacterium]|nr:replication-associated recombination protein A [Clostridia bacterium]